MAQLIFAKIEWNNKVKFLRKQFILIYEEYFKWDTRKRLTGSTVYYNITVTINIVLHCKVHPWPKVFHQLLFIKAHSLNSISCKLLHLDFLALNYFTFPAPTLIDLSTKNSSYNKYLTKQWHTITGTIVHHSTIKFLDKYTPYKCLSKLIYNHITFTFPAPTLVDLVSLLPWVLFIPEMKLWSNFLKTLHLRQ